MNIKELDFLPVRILTAIKKTDAEGTVEEIRIRSKRNSYLIVSGKNIVLNVIISENEMLQTIKNITNNSLYAYRDTIIKGYISYGNGIRIGIIGTASVENGKIIGVHGVSELAIRLPNRLRVDTKQIANVINGSSVLIYSPPGVGKTTLLRAIIRRLSVGIDAKRVCVIDTRDELACDIEEKNALVSVLCGYPRNIGMQIAIRSMNPQVMICDEIVGKEDLSALLEAQGSGVPIIASVHASCLSDIFNREDGYSIHKHHIFDYYLGIERSNDFGFIYKIDPWEEAYENI